MVVDLNIKDKIEEMKNLSNSVEQDLAVVNNYLISSEDMVEISELTMQVAELEHQTVTTKNHIRKIELGCTVYNKTKSVNDLLDISGPSLEEFGVDIESMLVDLSLGEEDVIASEEGIFSAIGKGLKSVFLLLVNIIKSIINIIIKFITAIFNFISGLFGKNGHSGGGGSSSSSVKRIKKTAKKNVKEQFDNLKNKIVAVNGVKEAQDLINAVIENNSKILIEKTLNKLGINSLMGLLNAINENNYLDYNKFIQAYYKRLSAYINKVKDLNNNPEDKSNKLPVMSYAFDSNNIMDGVSYYLFGIVNNIFNTLKTTSNENATKALSPLITDSIAFFKRVDEDVDFSQNRTLLISGDLINNYEEHFKVAEIKRLFKDLDNLDKENGNIYLFSNKIVFNDKLNSSCSKHITNLKAILQEIKSTKFLAINDVASSIAKLQKLSDVDLMTILYAGEKGIKIDGEFIKSEVTIDLLSFYSMFDKTPLVKLDNVSSPKHNFMDLVNEFNTFITANDVTKVSVLGETLGANYGLSGNLNLSSKLPNWGQVADELVKILKDANISLLSETDNASINIDIINLINDRILKNLNEEFKNINIAMSHKKEGLKVFIENLDTFISNNGGDDYTAKFRQLYKTIATNLDKNNLNFNDINTVVPDMTKAVNEVKNKNYMDISPDERDSLLKKYLKLAILDKIKNISLINLKSQYTYMLHVTKLLGNVAVETRNLSTLVADEEFITAIAVLSGFRKKIKTFKEMQDLDAVSTELGELEKELLKEL